MPTPLELLQQDPNGSAFIKAIELILSDPDAVAQKMAEADVLPPSLSDVPAESTPLPQGGGLPPISGEANVGVVPSPPAVPLASGLGTPAADVGASGGVDPNRVASFLQALQGVQAPTAPAPQRLPAAPGVPGAPAIQPGIDEILRLMAPQQQAVPIDLARLILGR